MVDVNVMLHELVPEHTLLSEKEADVVLKELRINADQLPKIRKDDPVLKILEMVEGPIEEGRIVKITRNSESAGISVVYRMVVERVK
ncbi:MAG: DNA-directed RNA polymerase subunit H [Thermoplasmata archaeon]|nr:MAG: DNA-directed RNA polymerase subunit H [Thermoplasmata archaeon]